MAATANGMVAVFDNVNVCPVNDDGLQVLHPHPALGTGIGGFRVEIFGAKHDANAFIKVTKGTIIEPLIDNGRI